MTRFAAPAPLGRRCALPYRTAGIRAEPDMTIPAMIVIVIFIALFGVLNLIQTGRID